MDTRQQTPPTAAPRPAWGDWCGFSPLADPPHDVDLRPAAFALLGDPVAYVVTGTELLGGGIVPGDTLIDLRALLPGYPAPLGIFDYAFADQLIGVVAGCYATGARDATIDWATCDWTDWNWSDSIGDLRRHLKALDAMIGPRIAEVQP